MGARGRGKVTGISRQGEWRVRAIEGGAKATRGVCCICGDASAPSWYDAREMMLGGSKSRAPENIRPSLLLSLAGVTPRLKILAVGCGRVALLLALRTADFRHLAGVDRF